jgi:lipoate-protein ligase A
MILWCDGAHGARENMRRDAALLALAEDSHERSEPVLRLFCFEPHGITIGASQRPERELDLDRCARDGIEWAVRPTGGRAIFHAEEWTYSWISAIDDAQWGGDRRAVYARIADVLAASLRALGADVSLSARREDTLAPRRATGAAAPCFASTTRDELTSGGRKVLGSAQRRARRTVLQQGSLLLSSGHERIVDYLALPEQERRAARLALRAAATHLDLPPAGSGGLTAWADALMAVLPTRIRRLDGADAFSLTG